MSTPSPKSNLPKPQPVRCNNTARQLAVLAEEVLEAVRAAKAEESLVDAYEQAAEHYGAKARRPS